MLLKNSVFILFIFASSAAYTLSAGDIVENIEVRDAEDNPAAIPDLGKKVLTIFYTDPDASRQNDPFADRLLAEKFDREKYSAIGIVNMKDTWKPNEVIRAAVRKRIKKYQAVILTDPDHILKNAWHLEKSDDLSVILVIGKDRKIYYIYDRGSLPFEEQEKAVNLIKKLIKNQTVT